MLAWRLDSRNIFETHQAFTNTKSTTSTHTRHNVMSKDEVRDANVTLNNDAAETITAGWWCGQWGLVDHKCVRFHGPGWVVERVGVLRRLALQLTLVVQRAGAAVTEEAVVTYKLHLVAAVASFDAVHADSIALRRVTSSAPVQTHTVTTY